MREVADDVRLADDERGSLAVHAAAESAAAGAALLTVGTVGIAVVAGDAIAAKCFVVLQRAGDDFQRGPVGVDSAAACASSIGAGLIAIGAHSRATFDDDVLQRDTTVVENAAAEGKIWPGYESFGAVVLRQAVAEVRFLKMTVTPSKIWNTRSMHARR